MLDQCRRQLANIKPLSGKHLMFAGHLVTSLDSIYMHLYGSLTSKSKCCDIEITQVFMLHVVIKKLQNNFIEMILKCKKLEQNNFASHFVLHFCNRVTGAIPPCLCEGVLVYPVYPCQLAGK